MGCPQICIAWGDGGGQYLAFLGRISPEKRPDRAIAIAKRAGLPLQIAAKVDRVDQVYHETTIAPLARRSADPVHWRDWRGREECLSRKCRALLFPIDWPEPFGLVLIEAMATGTPVIAFGCGSVPEIIEHGVTGFIVNDVDSAVAAVSRVTELNRHTIRKRFEERFTAERMARDYLRIYDQILGDKCDKLEIY